MTWSLGAISQAGTWKKATTTISSSGGASGTAGTALIASQCPSGYIFVPKNTTYTVVDFCVAKYEMKNDHGFAVSTASGNLYSGINLANSKSACQNMGAGYDLISNKQWQTIARNIAGVASNWSTGVVASGYLNQGHTDNSPSYPLVAVTDDNDACNGTGQTCSSTVWDSQRRTHTLSNGNVIWDLSGNLIEWVSTPPPTTPLGGYGTIATLNAGDLKQTLVGADSSTICNNSDCGMGGADFRYNNSFQRGGSYGDFGNAGIFTLGDWYQVTDAYSFFGFRCVFVP